jgi:hypothetical protein
VHSHQIARIEAFAAVEDSCRRDGLASRRRDCCRLPEEEETYTVARLQEALEVWVVPRRGGRSFLPMRLDTVDEPEALVEDWACESLCLLELMKEEER